MGRIETLLGDATPEARRAARVSTFASTGLATWAGSCSATLSSMAQEFGWDDEFEALVAEICAKFIRDYDPARERCWIADARRRAGRLGVPGQGQRRDRPAAPALRRSERPRPRRRPTTGRRLRRRRRARSATARSRSGPTTCSSPPAASIRRPASGS